MIFCGHGINPVNLEKRTNQAPLLVGPKPLRIASFLESVLAWTHTAPGMHLLLCAGTGGHDAANAIIDEAHLMYVPVPWLDSAV